MAGEDKKPKAKKPKEKKPYYIEPKIFKASLRKYYDSDILTDDLAENIKKIACRDLEKKC